jgi:tRNA pseudouridine(55) synthase
VDSKPQTRDYTANDLYFDDFGRCHGVLVIDKPVGMGSHDVVYKVRRVLGTRQVGHAGALDPFATGIIIVLVGKATKLSDHYLNHDKEYIADVLFGLQTDSADTEGNIIAQTPAEILKTWDLETVKTSIQQSLPKFVPEYEQYVPVFSSIKVDGDKLRVLARKFASFKLRDTPAGRSVDFSDPEGVVKKTVNLPKHLCQIPSLELIELVNRDISDLDFYQQRREIVQSTEFPVATLRVECSKGTYIRTLAEDIGAAQAEPPTGIGPQPAMLIGLRRTRVGEFVIANAITLEDLKQKYPRDEFADTEDYSADADPDFESA